MKSSTLSSENVSYLSFLRLHMDLKGCCHEHEDPKRSTSFEYASQASDPIAGTGNRKRLYGPVYQNWGHENMLNSSVNYCRASKSM